MLREIGDWFAALFLSAAVAVTLLGAIEWAAARTETTQATAQAFTVAVDAGHGGFDGGAVGGASGVAEAGLNLIVAKRVARQLENNGLSVVLTRSEDMALGVTKRKDLEKRREIISDESVDLVVSVHMNHFSDPEISGAMAFYQSGSQEGQKLAQIVVDAVTDATGRKRRLANPGDYFVLRECSAPAVLVECGFLSNADEEQKLLDESYLFSVADAIAEGVVSYLSTLTQG